MLGIQLAAPALAGRRLFSSAGSSFFLLLNIQSSEKNMQRSPDLSCLRGFLHCVLLLEAMLDPSVSVSLLGFIYGWLTYMGSASTWIC